MKQSVVQNVHDHLQDLDIKLSGKTPSISHFGKGSFIFK